jgi:hypothetical protein
MGHSVSPISNFEVDPSEDVTGRVPLQIFKGINNWNVKEGLTDTKYNMKISIRDTTSGITDPIPNGVYSVTIEPDLNSKSSVTSDLSLNKDLSLNYTTSQIMMITIVPKNTNTIKKHYADAFPEKFQIDFYLDPNCKVNFLKTDEDKPRINIVSNTIKTNQTGIISDESYTDYGSIMSDPSNPNYYLLSMKVPVNLKSISLIFTVPPPPKDDKK